MHAQRGGNFLETTNPLIMLPLSPGRYDPADLLLMDAVPLRARVPPCHPCLGPQPTGHPLEHRAQESRSKADQSKGISWMVCDKMYPDSKHFLREPLPWCSGAQPMTTPQLQSSLTVPFTPASVSSIYTGKLKCKGLAVPGSSHPTS